VPGVKLRRVRARALLSIQCGIQKRAFFETRAEIQDLAARIGDRRTMGGVHSGPVIRKKLNRAGAPTNYARGEGPSWSKGPSTLASGVDGTLRFRGVFVMCDEWIGEKKKC